MLSEVRAGSQTDGCDNIQLALMAIKYLFATGYHEFSLLFRIR